MAEQSRSGSRLIRFTPRLNPDVNGYWMCDIGRFDYRIESDRLRKPLVNDSRGHISRLVARRADPACRKTRGYRSTNPDGVRFLLSAHASHEELFLFSGCRKNWSDTSRESRPHGPRRRKFSGGHDVRRLPECPERGRHSRVRVGGKMWPRSDRLLAGEGLGTTCSIPGRRARPATLNGSSVHVLSAPAALIVRACC